MQGSGIWSPPTGTLGRIVVEATDRVTELRRSAAKLERAAADQPAPNRSLGKALRQHRLGVIAEVKRRSPSKGWINEGLSAVEQARAYASGGAAAISVLTEPRHFDGSIADLLAVIGAVGVPVLKKDFHVDPIQLTEARAAGATAALLIVRALDQPALIRMIDAAVQLDLETLVEVRDEAELGRALDAGAQIIGVNNRDLETLIIDSTTSERLIPRIPSSVVAIAESGMSTIESVQRAASFGADAVLVGSSLSASPNPKVLVSQLASVERVPRV